MRIGLVGGGTGGHFYPLIAIAEIIEAHPEKPELFYFGPSPYKPELLERHNIQYVYCPAGKLRRYFSVQNVLDFFRTIRGVFSALGKLYYYYPDVIFSKGGYTSIPILIAARLLRIPVVIHESDVRPGRANKFATSFARYIGISWPEAAEHFPEDKTALTGIPIRQSLLQQSSDAAAQLGIPQDLPLIFVTGGSSGAERINLFVLNALHELLPYVRIFHQTGDANEEYVKKSARELLAEQPDLLNRYYVAGHTDGATVAALLDASTLVISRAGSTSLFEIALHKKPSIVVPIPEEISHDQRANAYAYARTGAALVIEEHNLTTNLLRTELFNIIQDTAQYQKMQRATSSITTGEAAQIISDTLISIGHEHGS